MLGGHGQNYVSETIALAIGCVPAVLLVFFVVASILEYKLRGKLTVSMVRARALHVGSALGLERVRSGRVGWR